MTKKELKTLRDLNLAVNSSIDGFVYIDDLRKEAIKWIKQIRIKEIKQKRVLYSAEGWVRYFFNISEEELK